MKHRLHSTYEALTYDANNNQLTKRNRAGVTETFTYDALDRMATKVMPLSGGGILTTIWVYDLAGRVSDLSDSAGHGLAYTYDTAKRMIAVARTVPGLTGTQTVAYRYDLVGNRTRVTWPDSYYVQYQFDALNRMTTANENGTYLLAAYTYDKLSRRSALVYGNGAYVSYAYSQGSDLRTLAHNWLTGGGGATGNTYTHTFTRAHQLASASASDATFLWEPAAYQTNAYAAANNLNQYPTVTRAGIPSVLAYDANGNLTSDGVQTFGYDAENRLITAVKSGMSAAYTYDPMGRRAAKTVNTVSTFFLLSDDEEIGEYNASGSLIRRYVTGPGTDEPIAMVGTGSSPARDYFHEDRIGSVVAMTDNSGHVSQGPFTYDAYGQSAQTGGVPFRFTGRRLDPETGLYYFRARYYSAAEGRFLQTDPVGYQDQMNLYAYVANDPTNRTDPSGNCPWCFGAAVGGGLELAIQLSTPEGRAAYAAAGAALARGDLGGAVNAAGANVAKVAISAAAGAAGVGIAAKVAEVANIASKAAEVGGVGKVLVNAAVNAGGNAAAGAGLGAAGQAGGNAVSGQPLSSGTGNAALGGAAGGALGSLIGGARLGETQNLANAAGHFVGGSSGVAAPGGSAASVGASERLGVASGALIERATSACVSGTSGCNK